MNKNSLRAIKSFLVTTLKVLVIVGISYIILMPLITVVTNSFFTESDAHNPMVSLIPLEGTLDNFKLSFSRMNYIKTLGHTFVYVIGLTLLQLLICSMAGYGFARFKFPGKSILFACVILTIVIPTHTIMLPLYMTFRNFGIGGATANLLGSRAPMFIMTALGVGLRSGLYIYIFNQFFRGLPKEIEEAAFVDGAGPFYTWLRIMLPNAMPSVLTCTVFSIVWQYNDTFFARLFSVNSKYLISMKLSSLKASLEYVDKIHDTAVLQIYVYSGVVLALIPVLIIYILLQKRFIEGVERSGIVG